MLIAPEHREMTAFNVGSVFSQFTIRPFGLCNAQATFGISFERSSVENVASVP